MRRNLILARLVRDCYYGLVPSCMHSHSDIDTVLVVDDIKAVVRDAKLLQGMLTKMIALLWTNSTNAPWVSVAARKVHSHHLVNAIMTSDSDRYARLLPRKPLLLARELIGQLQRCLDVHAHQLLNKQLRRIRHRHTNDRAGAGAALAPAIVAHHAADLAHINLVRI